MIYFLELYTNNYKLFGGSDLEEIIVRRNINSKINEIIMDKKHKRRLCIIYGEFGIGKTVILDNLEKELLDRGCIRLNLFGGITYDYDLLKNAVIKYVKDTGVYYSNKKKSDANFRDKMFKFIKDLSLGFNLQIDTQGVLTSAFEFKIVDAMINLIEKMYESYTNSIKGANGDEIPNSLARITKEVCHASRESLYIIIDDIDKLDRQIAIYLNSLLLSDLNISLILSSESSLISINNPYLSDILNSHFINNDKTNDEYEVGISAFDVKETLQYIKMKAKSVNLVNDELAKRVHEYTFGIPILLSFLCTNIDNITKIKESNTILFNSNKYDLYYKKVLSNLSSGEKEILFILICNNMHMLSDVLENVYSNVTSNNSEFINEYEHLITENLIEERNDIVYLKQKMLNDYVIDKKLFSERRKKEYSKNIQKEYLEIADSKYIIEKHVSLSKIYLYLGKIFEAHESIVKAISLLNNEKMFDKSIDFILSILRDDTSRQFNSSQIAMIKYNLCIDYYSCKQMDKSIDTFNNITDQEKKYIEDLNKYSSLLLIVSNSYYYKNLPEKAIEYAEEAKSNNKSNDNVIFHQCISLISSSYDLLGKYNLSRENYFYGLKEAENRNDLSKIGSYKMCIQMISSNYLECIKLLNESINLYKKEQVNYRYLACCYNNIGIEHLMNGEFKNAKKYLFEAEKALTRYSFIESHFADNNLGLYYLLSDEKDLDKALAYLTRACKNSISPLQSAYTRSNKGIVLFEMGRDTDSKYYLESALDYAKLCPDPIVKSYVSFNLARFYFNLKEIKIAKTYLEQSQHGISKEQLKLFKIKRKRLLELIDKNSITSSINFENNQRRKLFLNSNWEPCELMFYN